VQLPGIWLLLIVAQGALDVRAVDGSQEGKHGPGVAREIGTQANREYESIFPALQVGPKAGSRAQSWRKKCQTWMP